MYIYIYIYIYIYSKHKSLLGPNPRISRFLPCGLVGEVPRKPGSERAKIARGPNNILDMFREADGEIYGFN